MKPITVLLAEDHLIVREGLRALLNFEEDIELICEAENGCQAVEQTQQIKPDVVVMDINMPLLNGMEATRQILLALPATRVLILSAHNDDAFVSLVMAIGASGYLNKQTAADLLPDAIRKVHAGLTCFSPAIPRCCSHQAGNAHASVELRSRNSLQWTEHA